MPGCSAWGSSSGLQTSFITSTWRWAVLQLVVSGAVAVLLLCLRRRSRWRGSSQTQLDASPVQRTAYSSSRAFALQQDVANSKPQAEQDREKMTQQLQGSVQSLLGEAAAKQVLQDMATAQAHRAATNQRVPLDYTAVTKVVPVSLKVNAPHQRLRNVGPSLLRHLSSTVEAVRQQGSSPTSMFVGGAAVFRGCIQLLANMFELQQQPAGAAGAGDGAAPAVALEEPAPPFGDPEKAQQLLQGVLQVMQADGGPAYETAACIGGYVAAVQGVGTTTNSTNSSSSRSSRHPEALSPVTLVCLDPPCATEGAAGALHIHLHTISPIAATSTSSSSSRTGRLVVCSEEGLLVDVPSVLVTDTIRLDLPALPAGVYQLALLPEVPPGAASAEGLAAACQPLFTHPLLVLPPAAAAELHQYWCGAISAAAVQGLHLVPGQQGALGATGGLPQPLAAMQHVWDCQLSSLICDLAAVMLGAAAAAAEEEEKEEHDHDAQQQRQQQQQLADSMGASLGAGTFHPAAFKALLQHLLAHLCKQQLWELVTSMITAGHSALACTEARGGPRLLSQPPRGPSAQGVAAGEGREVAGACSAPAAPAAADWPDTSRKAGSDQITSRGTSSSSSRHVGLDNASMPVSQGGGSRNGSAAVACSSQPPHLGAAEELAALDTWAGTWRQLSKGFSHARLESGYMEYMYGTSLPADVAVVPVLIVVALGHGVWTDAYVTHIPLWQQVAAQLLFVALFCVPSILLLAYRRRLRHGDR